MLFTSFIVRLSFNYYKEGIFIMILLFLSILLMFTTVKTVQFYVLKNNLRLQREFRKFIDTETKIIDVAKWIESEKVGKDLGDMFVSKWISKNAAELRKAWNRSKCRRCKNNCTHELRVSCSDFDREEIEKFSTVNQIFKIIITKIKNIYKN
jgi:hypothetical protein